MNFVANLHQHTDASIRDGFAKIPELVARAKELGYTALADTNHGTCSDLIQFYNECKKTGIKPILGLEAYFVHDINLDESTQYHMLFLAKNLTGYKNLMKLDTYAHQHFYKKPRIDMSILAELHDGLICSTACLAGILRQDDPVEDMWQLSDIFKDDLYCEIQPHPTPEQKAYNHKVSEWAKKHRHEVIITLDSHYVLKSDAKYHRYWLNLGDESSYYSTDSYYLMSTGEINQYMTEYHEYPQEYIDTCYKTIQSIVDKCNVEIEFGSQHYPNFCDDPEKYIRKRCNEGWRAKGVSKWPNSKEHIQRINYEIDMFRKVNYLNYICIIDDYIRWCTAKGIRTGMGRGSCCGSDVMYMMGCTKVDPLKWNLLFERFTNPERVTPCDVDVDVQASRRSELIQYIKDHYGEVYQVRTFGYIKPKSAIRKACEALGYDSVTKEAICKSAEIPEDVTDKKVKDIALHFLWHIEHFSTHASAVIVCPDEIVNYTATERQKNSKTKEYDQIVCYEFHDCEAMGLLKLDILGLKHLDIIDRVIKRTKADYDAIPNKDGKTAQMIRQGKTEGVFQSEGAGFTRLLQQLKTSEANDVIAANALFRPGSLNSGMTDEYIKRKSGMHPVTFPTPELEPALKDTYGLIIYQEEIMAGARALCGYSLGQADNVRRIIGRKIKEEMEPAVEDMICCAEKLGTPKKAVDEFVSVVEASADYCFNKSHAAAYGLTAWRSAYLKAHYPTEYMASFLEESRGKKEFPHYIKAVRDMGITIRHPELGCNSTIPVNGDIQLGCSSIKGVGNISAPLEKDNLRMVMKQYPANTLKALIAGGALDYFKIPRKTLIGSIKEYKEFFKTQESSYAAIERWKQNTKHSPEYIAKRIKYYEDKIKNSSITHCDNTAFNDTDGEMEVLGFTFGNPLANYDTSLVNNKTVFADFVQRFKEITDRRGNKMAFIDLANGMNITMFSRQFIKLQEGKPYLFGVRPEGSNRYILNSVRDLERVN